MWSERLKTFTQTSIWRFTLAFTLIVLVICSSMLAIIYQFTLGEQKKQLEQSVSVVAMGFIDLANTGNMNAKDFQQLVIDRSIRTSSLVLVLKTVDKYVGNLDHFTRTISTYPQIQRFPIAVTDYQGEPLLKIVVGTRVKTRFGDLTIALFDENQGLEQTYIAASIVTLLGASIFTLLAGLLFNRRVLLRVKEIATLTSQVKAGQLQTRLPVSRRNDEYDAIAEQINEMLDDIDALVHSVACVTDNIAHDLRTPLSRIRIGIDSYRSDEPAGSEAQLWRETMLAELDQLIDTFEAMLELSRLEEGVGLGERKICDLGRICLDAIDLVEPLAEEKNQTIKVVMHDSEEILGDDNLLFRAVYNVLQNAIKYTPEGGEVSLSVVKRTIVVEDNGPGVPEAEFDRIFERLYRLDKSRGSEGFGMGLAIVKAIVEWHEGKIILTGSKPGLLVTITF
jgi:signal transduction histidine kinase